MKLFKTKLEVFPIVFFAVVITITTLVIMEYHWKGALIMSWALLIGHMAIFKRTIF